MISKELSDAVWYQIVLWLLKLPQLQIAQKIEISNNVCCKCVHKVIFIPTGQETDKLTLSNIFTSESVKSQRVARY